MLIRKAVEKACKVAELIETAKYATDDGQVFEIFTYQERIPARTKDDPFGTVGGMKWTELSSGEKINYVDENTLRFVHRGQKLLHRVDRR